MAEVPGFAFYLPSRHIRLASRCNQIAPRFKEFHASALFLNNIQGGSEFNTAEQFFKFSASRVLCSV